MTAARRRGGSTPSPTAERRHPVRTKAASLSLSLTMSPAASASTSSPSPRSHHGRGRDCSRSLGVRRLFSLPMGRHHHRQAHRDAFPDHDNTRRMRRLDAWSHAELAVLQSLVERVTVSVTSSNRVLQHPFQSRRRALLSSVAVASSSTSSSSSSSTSTSTSTSATQASVVPRITGITDTDATVVPLKQLQADYPAWRQTHFREQADRRLRLRRHALAQLFPALADVPHAALKRVFAVFDRNCSGRVEFTELCETLAQCLGRVAWTRRDERVDVVCAWFRDKHARAVSHEGVTLLQATYRALARHYGDHSDQEPPWCQDLPRALLQGQTSVALELFRDRLTRFPQLVAALLRPFDILTPLLKEASLLRAYEAQGVTWRDGEMCFVVARAWWDTWVRYVEEREQLRAQPLRAGSDLHTQWWRCARPGPIANRMLCCHEGATAEVLADGFLRPGVELAVDFVLVTREMWDTLHALYGGGPEIPRLLYRVEDAMDAMDAVKDEDGGSGGGGGDDDKDTQYTNLHQQEEHGDAMEDRGLVTGNGDGAHQNSTSNGTASLPAKGRVRVQGGEGRTLLEVDLYPLCLRVRVVKTDTIHTALILARRFLVPWHTTLRQLLYRIGLSPGVNVHAVAFWVRRQRFSAWIRLECSLDAPRSSLHHLQITHSDELLIDFRAMGGGCSATQSSNLREMNSSLSAIVADDPLPFTLYQPLGNDFVATSSGMDSALSSSSNWARSSSNSKESTRRHGHANKQMSSTATTGGTSVSDHIGDFFAGQSGLETNTTGFLVGVQQQLLFTRRSRMPRLVTHQGVRATGLVNMGNTCFLNCALQCIGHSPILREYILSQRFMGDINKHNSLGTKGKIVTAYGRVMDAMWSHVHGEHAYFAPTLFRDEFARHRSQFQESSQHDAHEFIVSLLDSLHEDLNRKKPYHPEETLNGYRRAYSDVDRNGSFCLPYYGSAYSSAALPGDDEEDEEDDEGLSGISISAISPSSQATSKRSVGTTTSMSVCSADITAGSQSWRAHARTNSSIIVDLFHGQMRSETVCGTCDSRKVAFDPFLFFSVPIPEPKYVRIDLKIVLQVRGTVTESGSDSDDHPQISQLSAGPLVRRGFWLPRKSVFADLSAEVAHAYQLDGKNRFVIVEVRRHRIKRIFNDADVVDSIGPYRELYAYERAWALDDIPEVPPRLAIAASEMSARKGESARGTVQWYSDMYVGARVDALGYHGDWHPGTVVDMRESSETTHHHAATEVTAIQAPSDGDAKSPDALVAQGLAQRVLVHFDAFTANWDKWFTVQDWHDGRILPVNTKTISKVEVFEVQVVHRVVTPYGGSSGSGRDGTLSASALAQYNKYSYSRSSSGYQPSARETAISRMGQNLAFEVFGVPMFVTIATDRAASDLHDAILLQTTRFINGFDLSNMGVNGPSSAHSSKEGTDAAPSSDDRVPYEVRIVDLDDVGSALGVRLPKDSSHILQHFATQSVVVLDWKHYRSYSASEQLRKDHMPSQMVIDDPQAQSQPEHSSKPTKESHLPTPLLSSSTSLAKCLDALFQNEDISLEDHWICECCGQQRAGTRRSDVWKLPDLVMIQLKRFQYQENGYRQKVRTMVDFPMRGLDFAQWMGDHSTTGSSTPSSSSPDRSQQSPSPLQSPPSPTHQEDESRIYDLYAVANHVGGLARGHYTAYCRYDADFEESARMFSSSTERNGNPLFKDMWYRFDDEKVVEMAEGDVISDAAYVLFYKRRKLSPHNVLAYSF